MRKSIPAFICGLIGSLFSLWWGFVCGLIGNVGSLIGTAAEASELASSMNVVNLLGWLAFLGAIVGFVGAGYCFKKARRGAILLTVATLMCAPLQLYMFIKLIGAGSLITTIIIIFLLPVVLLIVATVLAYLAKEQPLTMQSYAAPQQPVASQQPATSGLEAELTNLKGMLDKGLLTEEEYNEAKKNAIEKHTK